MPVDPQVELGQQLAAEGAHPRWRSFDAGAEKYVEHSGRAPGCRRSDAATGIAPRSMLSIRSPITKSAPCSSRSTNRGCPRSRSSGRHRPSPGDSPRAAAEPARYRASIATFGSDTTRAPAAAASSALRSSDALSTTSTSPGVRCWRAPRLPVRRRRVTLASSLRHRDPPPTPSGRRCQLRSGSRRSDVSARHRILPVGSSVGIKPHTTTAETYREQGSQRAGTHKI